MLRSRLHRKPSKRAMFLGFSLVSIIWIWCVFTVVNTVMPIAHADAPEADMTHPRTKQMVTHPNMKVRDIVLSMGRLDFGDDQETALDNLLTHEAHYDPQAINPTTGACGIFQANPCNRMDSMSVYDQIKFGFDYIKKRYGTPEKAWKFWQERHPILINGVWKDVGNWY